MGREDRDLSPDAATPEEAFEHLLAAAVLANHQMLDLEKRLARQALGPPWMAGPHQAREAVSGDVALPEILRSQRRKIADGEIDVSLFQLVRQFRGRDGHGTDRRVRRLAPGALTTRGRNAISPTSESASVNERVAVAGSNVSPLSKSVCNRSISGRANRTIACARGVGTTPDGTRMNSGSSKASRIRRSAMLTAGWLIPSRRAARLTLSSSYKAKAIGRRFRSGLFVATGGSSKIYLHAELPEPRLEHGGGRQPRRGGRTERLVIAQYGRQV